MNKIAKYLNQYTVGPVYSAPTILDAYATDQSILKITPKIVALPTCTEDIRKIINFSHQLAAKKIKLPITVRYSGQNKTGAALGSGALISMEKMDKVEEIDPNQRLVRLQAGARLDTIQNTLALYGLYLPFEGNPDQTIGDLISEHITLNRSTKSGDTILNYIPQAEVVLSNGEVIHAEPLNQRQYDKKKTGNTLESKLYRNIASLIKAGEEYFDKIPDYKHNRSGYPTITKVVDKNKGKVNLLPLFFGAENTLGVVTEIILRCELLTDLPQYCVLTCPSLSVVQKYATSIIGLSPNVLDIYDIKILSNAESTGRKIHLWRNLPEEGYLMVAQFQDTNIYRRNQKVKQLQKQLPASTRLAISNKENYQDFVELDSAISTFCNNSSASILPVLDSAHIPNANLPTFITDLKKLAKAAKLDLPFYGSFLHETYTVRPAVNLNTKENRRRALVIMREYTKIVHQHKGNITGDSAEGRLKAIFEREYMDKKVIKIYAKLREIFDPRGILNPGVKQEATPASVVKELRTSYNPGILKP